MLQTAFLCISQRVLLTMRYFYEVSNVHYLCYFCKFTFSIVNIVTLMQLIRCSKCT